MDAPEQAPLAGSDMLEVAQSVIALSKAEEDFSGSVQMSPFGASHAFVTDSGTKRWLERV